MKKSMTYITTAAKYFFAAALLLFSLPSLMASAATEARGNLEAEGCNVAISLHLPQGKTEDITTLRLKLLASVSKGSMEEPSFQFDSSMDSAVASAVSTEQDGGGYLVDVILSGKKEQDIFNGSEDADIGILTLQPEKNADFSATVEIIDVEKEDNGDVGEPSIAYVDASGHETQTIALYNTSAATVTKEMEGEKPGNTEDPADSSQTTGTGDSQTATADGSSQTTGTGDSQTATADGSSQTTGTGDSQTATAGGSSQTTADGSTVLAAPGKVKRLAAQYKNRIRVSLSWSRAENASGYEIYRSASKKKGYTLIKTIKKGTTTSCTIKQKNDTLFYYKIRASQGKGDEKKYGAFTAAVPSRVQRQTLTATARSRSGFIAFKWNKAARADGYGIYQYNAKTKKYSLVKIITRGATASYLAIFQRGTSYRFAIRGYELLKGKKSWGFFSIPVKVATAPPKVASLSLKAEKGSGIALSWKKGKGASGYQVYRRARGQGSFHRIATLNQASLLKYTDQSVKSGRTYYYKVRAYVKGSGKTIFGNYSDTLSVKAQ